MSRSLSINLFLRPFSVAIHEKFYLYCVYLFIYFLVCKLYKSGLQIVPLIWVFETIWDLLRVYPLLAKVRGKGNWNFGIWVFFGRLKYLRFHEGVDLWGGMRGGVMFLKGWSVRSPSILSFWNTRNFKKISDRWIGAGIQVDIDFTTESKIYCSKSSSFYPSGTHNQPNPWNCLLFYLFVGFEAPFKPSIQ